MFGKILRQSLGFPLTAYAREHPAADPAPTVHLTYLENSKVHVDNPDPTLLKYLYVHGG